MTDNSLINLGGLAKPVTTLIEKISGAIGRLYEPRHIRHIAQANADAAMIAAKSKLDISEIEQRAMARMLHEETRKQANIEAIAELAMPLIANDSQPEKLDDDWLAHFFSRCKHASNDKIRSLWAKILAGESNSPGSFSVRTLAILEYLEQRDAIYFTSLCTFRWHIGTELNPFILIDAEDLLADKYKSTDVSYAKLAHLESLGLIHMNTISGYTIGVSSGDMRVSYYGQKYVLTGIKQTPSTIDLGNVMLTNPGKELQGICEGKSSANARDGAVKLWSKEWTLTPVS